MPVFGNILLTFACCIVLVFLVPLFLVGARFDFLGSMTESWIRMTGLVPFAAGVVVMGIGLFSRPPRDGREPTGLCRRVRNPVWLGALVAIFSQYLLYDWPPIIAYGVVLFVVADCLLRFAAEPAGATRSGAAFEAWCETVPRWIPHRSARVR